MAATAAEVPCVTAAVGPVSAAGPADASASLGPSSARAIVPPVTSRPLELPVPSARRGALDACYHSAFRGRTGSDLDETRATLDGVQAGAERASGQRTPVRASSVTRPAVAPDVPYEVDVRGLDVSIGSPPTDAESPAEAVEGAPRRAEVPNPPPADAPVVTEDAAATAPGNGGTDRRARPAGGPIDAGTEAAIATTPAPRPHGKTTVAAFVLALFLWVLAALGLRLTALWSPRRRALLEHVRARPGLSVREAAELLGLARQSARYHLWHLERAEHVRAVREGRLRLYFARAADASAAKTRAALRSTNARRILDLFAQKPSASQREAAQRLGVSSSTVRWHLDRLAAAGLLERRPARVEVRGVALARSTPPAR